LPRSPFANRYIDVPGDALSEAVSSRSPRSANAASITPGNPGSPGGGVHVTACALTATHPSAGVSIAPASVTVHVTPTLGAVKTGWFCSPAAAT
jgi:hypothetical protein